MTNFNNWKLFQYDNLNIQPGDWRMPCGTDEKNTKVTIRQMERGAVAGEIMLRALRWIRL